MVKIQKGLVVVLVEGYDVGHSVRRGYVPFGGNAESNVLEKGFENASYHYRTSLEYCTVQVLMGWMEVSQVRQCWV